LKRQENGPKDLPGLARAPRQPRARVGTAPRLGTPEPRPETAELRQEAPEPQPDTLEARPEAPREGPEGGGATNPGPETNVSWIRRWGRAGRPGPGPGARAGGRLGSAAAAAATVAATEAAVATGPTGQNS
jgi:hypothetical protein